MGRDATPEWYEGGAGDGLELSYMDRYKQSLGITERLLYKYIIQLYVISFNFY